MDLSKLTKKQKLELLDAIEEKKRRARNTPGNFVPHPGQLKILQDTSEERFVFSGNGFGKTALLANQALAWLRGFDPWKQIHNRVPSRVIVVLDRPEKVDEAWLPELRRWATIRDDQLKKHGKPYYTEICFDNGSSLVFKFHDQEALTFESIEAEYIVFDEHRATFMWPSFAVLERKIQCLEFFLVERRLQPPGCARKSTSPGLGDFAQARHASVATQRRTAQIWPMAT